MVPEHDGPHMMEDHEHDRLSCFACHGSHIIDDKPQSTIRWMMPKTVSQGIRSEKSGPYICEIRLQLASQSRRPTS